MKRNIHISSIFFKIGASIFILLGFGHFLGTLVDIVTPFLFTPVDDHVKNVMINAKILITDDTSLWSAWIGFNVSHGFGVFLFGFILLLLACRNYDDIIAIKFILPLSIIVSLGYLSMSLLFWFYLPSIGCSLGAICFIVSFVFVKNEWFQKKITIL